MGIQFFWHERLLHVVVDAKSVAGLHIIGRREGRGEDDDHIAVSLTDTLHHLETVHHRHVYIGDNDVWMDLLPGLQALLPVGSGGHVVAADDILETSLLDIR